MAGTDNDQYSGNKSGELLQKCAKKWAYPAETQDRCPTPETLKCGLDCFTSQA